MNDIRADYPGGWPGHFEPVLAADPEIMAAFASFQRCGWEKGPLSDKMKQFILLAINASATHLYLPGVRHHAAQAITLGATRGELLEILEMTSVIGIHSCTIGFPILAEENTASGQPPLSAKQEQIKARFQAERGWWSDFLETMLRFAPDLVESYVSYSTVPWKRGAFSPKDRELIYIAIDCQTTHLFPLGLRAHIRNALRQGATADEIAQVIALISGIGFHTLTTCLPVIDELLGAG